MISRIDPDWTNQQVCEHLGERTGFIVPPRDSWNPLSRRAWIVESTPKEIRFKPQPAPSFVWMLPGLILVTLIVCGLAWYFCLLMVETHPEVRVLGPAAAVLGIGGMWSALWMTTGERSNRRMPAVYSLRSKLIRSDQLSASIVGDEVVRLERVWVRYLGGGEVDGKVADTDLIPHFVICTRPQSGCLRWVQLFQPGDEGLEHAMVTLAEALRVPWQRVEVVVPYGG